MKFKSAFQKYLEEKEITYQEYVESSHWQKKKKEFKSSSYYQGCCWVCGKKKYLHVHHITYENIGRELLCDLLELCSDCHNRLHLSIKTQGWPLLRAHVLLLEQKEKEQKLPPIKDEVREAERKGKLASGQKWKRPKKLKQKRRKRRKCIVCGRWTGKYGRHGQRRPKNGLHRYCSLCRPQPYTLI